MVAIRETVYPCVEYSFVMAQFTIDEVEKLEAKILRACRKALGLCKNDSKDMMIAPLLHMGFGLTSLVER